MDIKIGDVVMECVRGDITAQSGIEAIVNAANAELKHGGGVAGAIHRAAGPGLEDECRPLAPIRPGACVITGGHHLPNRFVIHCLGPVYGLNKPEDELLAACYRNALRIAEKNKIASIAFPAISTGIFGYPIEDAARIAFDVVAGAAPGLKSVKRVRFVLFSDADLEVYERIFSEAAR